MDIGNPWGTNLASFEDFFVIWTIKVQCGFQSCFLCDLGVDMAPACDVWMCSKHSKYNGFRQIYTFAKVQVFGVSGKDLGFILGGFWRPWDHFSSFLKVPEDVGI